jgi:NurA domain
MPFENEIATGESLIALQKSPALRDFEGFVALRDTQAPRDPAPIIDVPRSDWLPLRVVAIDGSSLTHKVRNGFPGAEASIVLLSVVFIDVSKLAKIAPGDIPSPRIFHEMDRAHTLDAVLPGANIVRKTKDRDSPVQYFRSSVFETLTGRLDREHESLLETARVITKGRRADILCPIEDCKARYKSADGEYSCDCSRAATLFETDAFRFHERFNELGSNGEVHGEVRHVLEVLSLVNILRFFEKDDRIRYLKNCAFILDGPLAVFGQPAWLAPYIRAEIIRISEKARRVNGQDILVLGIEKSGQYVNHFADLDWTDKDGPRSKFSPGTVLIPDSKYVNRNIVFRPADAKPSGADTYFGRKVFYKTRNSAHAVINMAIVNKQSEDFDDVTLAAFPRLGDALNVLDHLSTYLYQDGFMPLVRAHAHAAIPLQRGTDIIMGLFGER